MALPPEAMAVSAGGLMHFDAPRLFGTRAAAARPGFRLDEANAARVAGICARLDGIPLAIELAAALTRYLALDELDARLVDRYALLKDGRHATRPGHETLRAAMDWSYELLTTSERQLHQRLSVFSGGWTLEAAEAVCTGEDIDAREVLALLAQLEAKSLIVVEYASGERRFRMLETVRQYAGERLAGAGDEAERRDRHMAYFLDLAKEASPHTEGAEQAVWLKRLEAEQANLSSTFDWIIARGDFARGSWLAYWLMFYWHIRGEWRGAYQRMRTLLEGDDPPSATMERMQLLATAASFAGQIGVYSDARQLYEEALALSMTLGRSLDTGRLCNGLAILAETVDHDYARARELYEQGLAISRAHGDKHTESAFLHNLGSLADHLGDRLEAIRLIEQSLEIDRELDDLFGVASTLQALGHAYWNLGEPQRPRALYEESLAICRELGARHMVAQALANIGVILVAEGDCRQALPYLQESLALHREEGSKLDLVVPLTGLGAVQVRLGDYAAARGNLEKSLAIAVEAEHSAHMSTSLEGLASLEMALKRPERAARLIGAAAARLEGDGLTRSVPVEAEVAEILARAAEAIGPEARDAAVAEGYAMAPDAAVAYALGAQLAIA